jgi:hypothetical protein
MGAEAIIVAILLTFPAAAWFGLSHIPEYFRTGRQLPAARAHAYELRRVYLSNFGSRKDACTFLTLIGADDSRGASGGGLRIPMSAKRELADEAYLDSIVSFVVGNLTRPITRAASNHFSNWWQDVKARFTAESGKPDEQVALEQQLRTAFARYQSLKSVHSVDGVFIGVGFLALIASVFIAIAAYDFIQSSL